MRMSKPDTDTDNDNPSTPLSTLPIKLQRLISSIIQKRNDCADQITELESSKKVYTDEITRIYQENDLTAVTGNGWKSQFKTRTTRSLSESKLLDHGVSIKTIQACTEEKVSEPFLEIRKVKEKG